jgi:hypothetical protein
MSLPPTFIMSSQERRNSMPITNPTPNKDNIIVCWQDGIVQCLIDENLRAKSKSVGIQHAMDILDESSFFEIKISQYSPIEGRALDKAFIAKLPPRIKPGNILKPSQLPPRMWIDSSSSECKSPTKTAACNDQNDQESVVMMLSPGCTDLKCVTMTPPVNNTGPIGSGQIDQFPVPILKTRTTTNVWPKNAKMLTMIKAIIEAKSPCPAKPEFCFKMTLEAAEKNFMVLKCYNFEPGKAIEA